MVSTPKPPDPVKTAQAQAGMNRDTAITQQQLNMVDQYGPTGSSVYTKNGVDRFQDSNGKWIETPKYQQTTTLTPEQQAIFNKTQQAQTNLAGIAVDQSDKMGKYLNDPFQFNNQDAANWAYDLGAQRLDPRFAQDEDRLRTSLASKGIREGSAAWDAEMGRLGQSKTDAYNQLMLQGRGQAFNEALTTRNQPINELNALLSSSQVQQPSFQATPQTGVGGVDYTGLVNQQYQAKLQNSQNMMGGLFGLASAGLGLFSDERLKEDIKRVGETDDGTPIYTYRYKGDDTVHMGVLAQEAAEDSPEAVARDPSGYLAVDYGKVH